MNATITIDQSRILILLCTTECHSSKSLPSDLYKSKSLWQSKSKKLIIKCFTWIVIEISQNFVLP